VNELQAIFPEYDFASTTSVEACVTPLTSGYYCDMSSVWQHTAILPTGNIQILRKKLFPSLSLSDIIGTLLGLSDIVGTLNTTDKPAVITINKKFEVLLEEFSKKVKEKGLGVVVKLEE